MKQPLYCPYCKSIQLENLGHTTPENGGDIYVAEDMECSTECYALVSQIKCTSCQEVFFVIDEVE